MRRLKNCDGFLNGLAISLPPHEPTLIQLRKLGSCVSSIGDTFARGLYDHEQIYPIFIVLLQSRIFAKKRNVLVDNEGAY